jgi:predicted DNA-binding transcriptional regulator YafY
MLFFLLVSRHLERLLRIDALLRSSVRVTTGSLAVELEVSDRFIVN